MSQQVYPRVIAEIGCNHKGEMAIARDLIESAARFAKADFVKFQKRCNRELLTDEEYHAPHPNPANSYGEISARIVITADTDDLLAIAAACFVHRTAGTQVVAFL